MQGSSLEKIALFMRASNLPVMHNASHNANLRYDPFVVISYKTEATAFTEVIENNRNPHWPIPVVLEYKFQERQALRFQVYYKVANFDKKDRASHICLGETTMTLKELVEEKTRFLTRNLTNGNVKGPEPARFSVHAESIINVEYNFRCRFHAVDLVHKCIGNRHASYIAVQRMFEDGSWVTVFKNKAIIFDNLNNCSWPVSVASLKGLCNGDQYATLKFSVMSNETTGVDTLIGETDETCLREILRRTGGEPFPLFTEKDNYTAAVSTRAPKGRLHIYNPTLEGLDGTNVSPLVLDGGQAVPVAAAGAGAGAGAGLVEPPPPPYVEPNIAAPAPAPAPVPLAVPAYPEVPEIATGGVASAAAGVAGLVLGTVADIAVGVVEGTAAVAAVAGAGALGLIDPSNVQPPARNNSGGSPHGDTPHNDDDDGEAEIEEEEEFMEPTYPPHPDIDTFNMGAVYDPKDIFEGTGASGFTRSVLENWQAPPPTFANFLSGGCQFQLAVAIDFTSSNGSLHAITTHTNEEGVAAAVMLESLKDPTANVGGDMNILNYTDERLLHGLNPYQKAILSVGSVIADYDSDKRIPLWGFGAKMVDPNTGLLTADVSHCFNLDQHESEVYGMPGIMHAYGMVQSRIGMHGPTLFAPCLRKCLEHAVAHPCTQENQVYHVMVILTDGITSDKKTTKDLLVELAHHPVSVIIIGIGDENFDAMAELDGRSGPLRSSTGELVCRDIVQFVPFKRFLRLGVDALRNEVLSKIPDQLLHYMHLHNIKPKRRY